MSIFQIQEPGEESYVVDLDLTEDKKVGSLPSNQLCLKHDSVERLHGILRLRKKFFGLGELAVSIRVIRPGTTTLNGRGKNSPEHKASAGDCIGIGEVKLTVVSV